MDNNLYKSIIVFLISIFILLFLGAYDKNSSICNELYYKNKIIKEEFNRNFESYEEYCLWKAEKLFEEVNNG